MSRALLALTLLGVFISGCTRTVNVYIPQMGTYTNNKYGFSIKYPADWRVESETMGYVVGFVSSSGSPAYVIIASRELPAESNLQEYNAKFYEQLKEAASFYQKEQENLAVISGEAAIVTTYKLIYKMTPYSILRQMTVNVAKEGIVYSITCTAPEDYAFKSNDFFDKMIQSFQFVPRQLPSPAPPHEEKISSKMRTYKDPTYNFSIEYVENWNVIPNYQGNAVVFSELMTEQTMRSGHTSNVAVLKPSTLPSVLAMEDIVRKTEGQLESKQPSYKRLDEYETIINGNRAIILVFTVLLEEKNISLKSKYAFLAKGENLYIIACNTLAEKYDESDDIFEKMIYSFMPPE